jgi:hypothetical protein
MVLALPREQSPTQVKNPIKVVAGRNGATKYIGRDATVVLNKAGKVITTWARNSAGRRL